MNDELRRILRLVHMVDREADRHKQRLMMNEIKTLEQKLSKWNVR